ncbi:Glyoxalase/Bleomycin resistance protein/Dihydroxybiphenyl dioxygenase [Mycena floridula]|nr:Glyoxalase/Bleomycin resistance protein/Dihydroxybiphenyl dioxygenase [Mycena floridula]
MLCRRELSTFLARNSSYLTSSTVLAASLRRPLSSTSSTGCPSTQTRQFSSSQNRKWGGSRTNLARNAETASFKLNHSMIRIKDPAVSLKFYTEVLGMDLLSEHKFDGFTLYFLAFDEHDGTLTAEEKERSRFSREGVLELTHNHGTESDPDFAGYSSGNSDPGRGFGHLAITVDDVDKACDRFEKLDVTFKKRPSEGTMRDIAFILDPDGYWIEILPGVLGFKKSK